MPIPAFATRASIGDIHPSNMVIVSGIKPKSPFGIPDVLDVVGKGDMYVLKDYENLAYLLSTVNHRSLHWRQTHRLLISEVS